MTPLSISPQLRAASPSPKFITMALESGTETVAW